MPEHTPPTHGKSIVEQLWDRLDEMIDQIKSLDTMRDPEMPVYQGAAKGLAFAIQLMCQPYYAEEKDVARQALRRWRMRQGDIEWEPTPGYKYNPPPAGTKYVVEKPKVVANKSVPTLTTKEKNDARYAINGGIPKSAIAKMHKMTEAELDTALATP